MNRLFFAQDVGSAQFLAPLARALDAQGQSPRVFARLGGEPAFGREGVPCTRLEAGPSGLTLRQARSWLREQVPDLLVCGTSGVKPDRTAVNLVLAARGLGVPSLGFLDHWKGWDRFAGKGRPDLYLPDRLGVPDAAARDCLMGRGLPGERLFVTGHPWLAERADRPRDPELRARVRRRLGAAPDEPVLVLVSQPLPGRTGSLLRVRDGRRPLPRVAIQVLEKARGRGLVVLRPHPREAERLAPQLAAWQEAGPGAPVRCRVDAAALPEELLCAADLLLGGDSLFLVEASLRGVPTLALRDLPGYANPCFSATKLVRAVHMRELEQAVAMLLANPTPARPTLTPKNALHRCLAALKERHP